MNLSDRTTQLAVQRRLRWAVRHGRSPTRVMGLDGIPLFACEHPCGSAPLFPRPLLSTALTPELAWRVAYDPIAIKIEFRGALTALLCPLLVPGECEDLRAERFLPCDAPDFRQAREAVLASMHQGDQTRVLVRFRDLLLAHLLVLPLEPIPPGDLLS